MDGIETTKNLRDLGYTAPIVALTANAIVGQAEMFLLNGFDEFISKPIDVRQLNSVLNKLIRDKQPPEVIEATRQKDKKLPAHEDEQFVQSQTGRLLLNKEVTGLDMLKGIQQYNGDEKIYLKVLRSYAASVRSMLGAIETVSEDTLDGYKIKVHGIKGASLDIFAGPIGESARNLEEAAINGDLSYINQHNPAFIELARKLVNDLEDMLSDINDANPKPKKDKVESALLSRLIAACTDYNMDEVDNTMSEIEMYQYESDSNLLDWLREKVDMMNYSQIVEKLSELDNQGGV
jgi:hypothetical protein